MRCVANNALRNMHNTKGVLHRAHLARGLATTRRHVVAPVQAAAAPVEKVLTGLTHGGLSARSHPQQGTTNFDYLFAGIESDPSKHLPGRPEDVVKALTELGIQMMREDAADNDANESKIPAIYTYWGQFLDHDMTANTDRDKDAFDITKPNLEPLLPATVKEKLKNLREPALNLDSVYGDGPFVPANKVTVPYVGIKFELGPVSKNFNGGELVLGTNGLGDDLLRDLPRRDLNYDKADRGTARIGDDRNDENLIVAQLHVAFLRFHNNAVDWVMANEPALDTDEKIFNRARDITRWTYQWIVVQDFLKTIAKADIVDKILTDSTNILDLDKRGTYMPLEFSVAAYRFGHSMIRAIYDWNKNFGKPGLVLPDSPFRFLFSFTGKPKRAVDRLKPPPGSIPRPDTDEVATELPGNWPADWARMVFKDDKDAMHFARRIDTKVSPPMGEMVNEGVLKLLQQLAVRNLLRGYLLSLPTGQAVAAELKLTPLTRDELLGNTPEVDAALTNGSFLDATPLWFYILKEAEVQSAGKPSTLGDVGSTIVASTIIAHIKHDPGSFLGQAGWTPEQGVKIREGDKDVQVATIADFLRFAKVLDEVKVVS